MNGRQLLIATLRGERTDRMPVSPFIAHNNVYEMFRYKPEIDSFLCPPDFDLAVHAEAPEWFRGGLPPAEPGRMERCPSGQHIGGRRPGPVARSTAGTATSRGPCDHRARGCTAPHRRGLFEATPHHLFLSERSAATRASRSTRRSVRRRSATPSGRCSGGARSRAWPATMLRMRSRPRNSPPQRPRAGCRGGDDGPALPRARAVRRGRPCDVGGGRGADRPARWLGQPLGRIRLRVMGEPDRGRFQGADSAGPRRLNAAGMDRFEGKEAIFPREHYRDGERVVEDGEYSGPTVGQGRAARVCPGPRRRLRKPTGATPPGGARSGFRFRLAVAGGAALASGETAGAHEARRGGHPGARTRRSGAASRPAASRRGRATRRSRTGKHDMKMVRSRTGGPSPGDQRERVGGSSRRRCAARTARGASGPSSRVEMQAHATGTRRANATVSSPRRAKNGLSARDSGLLPGDIRCRAAIRSRRPSADRGGGEASTSAPGTGTASGLRGGQWASATRNPRTAGPLPPARAGRRSSRPPSTRRGPADRSFAGSS